MSIKKWAPLALFALFCFPLLFVALRFNSSAIQTDVSELLLKEALVSRSALQVTRPLLQSTKQRVSVVLQGRDHREVAASLQRELLASSYFEKIPDVAEVLHSIREGLRGKSVLLPSTVLREALSSTKPVETMKQKLALTLFSPFFDTRAVDLKEDPLLTRYFFLSDQQDVIQKRFLQRVSLPTHTSLLSLRLKEEVLSGVDHRQLSELIEHEIVRATSRKEVSYAWTGYIRFAADSSKRLRTELEFLLTLASLAIVITTIVIFRSPWQIILSLLSVFIGFCVGSAVSLSVFGSLHAITLGFGAGLLGVSVDYALHYFCEQLMREKEASGAEIFARIVVPISMGMLTSGIVFVVLGIASFPGLKELAVFSCAGLFASYVTVCLLFPSVSGGGFGRRNSCALRVSEQFFQRLLVFFQKRGIISLSFFVLILTLPGLLLLQANDDVGLLQEPRSELLHDEINVRRFLPFNPSGFLVLQKSSPQDVLNEMKKVGTQLSRALQAGELISFFNIADFIPSLEVQHEFLRDLKKLLQVQREDLVHQLGEIGIESSLLNSWIDSIVSDKSIDTLSVSFLLSEDRGRFFSSYIQRFPHATYGVIPVEGFDKRMTPSLPGVLYVEFRSLFSELFEAYRVKSVLLTIIAYSIILIVLIFRYGVRSGCRVLLPSVFTAMILLSFMGYCSISLNFFHILGLIIVLGLSVDYNIFFYEEEDCYPPVCLTVLLSTLSTFMAFGGHMFSSTLVLRSFGLTIGGGVLIATLLAPLAKGRRNA